MKQKKMHKDKELKGRTFILSGNQYYRGEHGEIRSKTVKLHLSKKARRRSNVEAKELASRIK
jgi:hypothetical protein